MEAARTTAPLLALATLAALGLAAALPQAAHAQTTVNFENLPNPSGAVTNPQGRSVTQNGFTVAGGAGSGLFSVSSAANSANYTGSVAIFNGSTGILTTLTRSGGGPFSLNSVSIANINKQATYANGATVLFTGSLQGSGTVTQSFTLAASDALQTFQFAPTFTNLASVSFVETDGFAQYDNFVLNTPAAATVPEPSSVAAFAFTALGAAGLMLRARRRAAGPA